MLMSDEPRLLVVDDEEAICEGCSRIFSRQGFAVEKCSDAAVGLSLATEAEYSAILLDIKMPGMDGIHFLEALREEQPTTPVVLMTGYPSIPNAASAIRLGVSDYVTKPFTPEEISQAVHRLLQQGRWRSGRRTAGEAEPRPTRRFHFYRDAWYQTGGDGAVRVGAWPRRAAPHKFSRIRLPRIGEVVYQGLPLAAVVLADQSQHPSPRRCPASWSSVNGALDDDPPLLLADPCGQGWIACISPDAAGRGVAETASSAA